MRGVPLDRAMVHAEIWKARDKHGKVKIYQKQFAEYLKISQFHMSRVIGEFEAEGRIKKVGARYRNIGIYVVTDPANFGEVSGLSSPQ